MVSIQSSYTFTSKCKWSSPFENCMSCSLLTSWFYSLNCFFCEDAFYCTLGLNYLNYVSYGVGICGIYAVCLAACATISTIDGSTLAFIIFYALRFVLSCSLFTLELEAPPSSILLFFLRALLGEFIVVFFLFSNVVCISSLVLKTLVGGFCGFYF